MTSTSLNRRDLFRTAGAIGVAFTLGPLRVLAATSEGAKHGQYLGKPVDGGEIDSFLVVHEDGTATVFTGKVDLGTGLRIAVRQMAAEELGLKAEQVELIEGDTALTPDQGRTGGSSGLTQGGVGVRQAAATAREMLIGMAAERLKKPASELLLADGQIRPKTGGGGIRIGELAAGKRLNAKVNAKVTLKDPSTHSVVGRSLARPDVPGKCTGTQMYVSDLALPGMLHGRVIRPNAIGAKLVSVDEASVASLPGVKVVRVNDFLGVVALDEWAAVRAAATLKATWSDWNGLPATEQVPKAIREGKINSEQQGVTRGDAKRALATAPRKFSATYYFPYQSHASMGPSCAVADYKPDGLTVWTGSQSTHLFRTIFSESFGLPAEKVRMIYLEGSGCYGQNGHEDAAADAVILSRAVGSPVRVQWMRHDEHGWDPKGPPQLLDVRAGLDEKGNVVAWETEIWVPVAIAARGTIPLVGLDAAGITQRQGRWPGSVDENLDPPYAAPNVNVAIHRLQDSPLRPGHVRAPGKVANAWAVESLADELAVAAGEDSVAWRLRNLTDPRAVAVLSRAAEMLGWQKRVSPDPKALSGKVLRGRGVSYVRYRGNENYVAMAMEVAVDPATGQVKVERVTCAHDCGLVVNPDALKNQIEGSIIQTLSKMLYEEVKIDTKRVTSIDWVSYPVLRFPDVPKIEVSLLDQPHEPVMGGGEASLTPVGGALGNAIFDATGVRLRTVPFTPARVKAALAERARKFPAGTAA